MFSIKDFFLSGIDSDVLQHADEVEGAELLDEAEPVFGQFLKDYTTCPW